MGCGEDSSDRGHGMYTACGWGTGAIGQRPAGLECRIERQALIKARDEELLSR